MANFVEQCLLCGLTYYGNDGAIDVGDNNLRLFKCPDTISCAERWLVKFMGGRPLSLESVSLVGQAGSGAPVFEVDYQIPGPASRKRKFTLEVHSGEDVHRDVEHYHLVEGGRDLTSAFVP